MKKIILALCLFFTVNLAFSIDLYWEPVYSNFEYNMKFTKTQGFKPVLKLTTF